MWNGPRAVEPIFWQNWNYARILAPCFAPKYALTAGGALDKKQFYGRVYHFNIPPISLQHYGTPHVHFLWQYHVDTFLVALWYNELLGFLPDDPNSDSYAFAVREANKFWALCEDPAIFLDDDQKWFDSHSDMKGGDPIAGPNTAPGNSSCTDWDLNHPANHRANHRATETANWASVKHQHAEEDLERMRPWLAWIPVENIRKTLENTTQMAKAVSNYPMIRHLTSRFRLLSRFRLREIVSIDTIFSSVRAVGGARCAQVFYGLTSHHMDVYGMESKSQFPDLYKEFIRDQGVPSGLHRDNAMEQRSNVITQLNRDKESQGIIWSTVTGWHPTPRPLG
jgi:hypothetical protein